MLTIEKKTDGDKVTFALEGRLDINTAPQLETALEKPLETAKELVFDFKNLRYISSAGLRVLLLAQKRMNLRGRMRLINVSDEVMRTLEITGFVDIFFVAE